MNDSSLAPIILFAHKRPKEVAEALTYLKANYLASQSDLFIFVDGPKKESDVSKVQAVSKVVNQVSGFRTVTCQFAEKNQGLANSVIAGVSQIMKVYGRAIVLEDDLLPTPNFLDFMNQALQKYQCQPTVYSITGYTFPFTHPTTYLYDGYWYGRTGSWGWATWVDRWQNVDWQLSDYDAFLADPARCQAFSYYGSDRLRMLRRWKEGKIDSWAIRWCYAQSKVNGLTLYPTESKINNIGFSADSTNTHGYNRYRTVLDEGTNRQFRLPEITVDSTYYKRRMRWKFSIPVRISNRLLTHAKEVKRFFKSPP